MEASAVRFNMVVGASPQSRCGLVPLPVPPQGQKAEEQQVEAGDRVKCRYCLSWHAKDVMERIPPEVGKTKNVVRMACPKCVKKIVDRREMARNEIKDLLK